MTEQRLAKKRGHQVVQKVKQSDPGTDSAARLLRERHHQLGGYLPGIGDVGDAWVGSPGRLLAACFGAMVVMNLLGIAPIYDLLRDRAERRLQQTRLT